MTAANTDEREMIIELFEGKTGLALEDKGLFGGLRQRNNVQSMGLLLKQLLGKT
nr:hypothetical protein [Thorsellia anophelis]